jgi:hypothetical protein
VATQADLDALGRIIASEVGPSGSADERIALGWLARNRAAVRKVSISKMAMPPAKQGAGRPFSSARPATPEAIEAARAALDGKDDPTHGAYAGFEPALQDRLFAEGRKGYSRDASMVRAKWLREMDYYGSVGAWDLFGRRGGAGAKPIPEAWGIGTNLAAIRKAPIRGPVTLVTNTRSAALGGYAPWLLLLFVLAYKRR